MTAASVPGPVFMVDQPAYARAVSQRGADPIGVAAVVIGGPGDGTTGMLPAVRTRDGRITFPGLLGLRLGNGGPWHMPLSVCHRRPDNTWALHDVGARVCECPSYTPPAQPALAPVAPAGHDLGHVLVWDPPAATGKVERWSCACGSFVLRAGATVYGSGTVYPCPTVRQRLDGALRSATDDHERRCLTALTLVLDEHDDGGPVCGGGPGLCRSCTDTVWPCATWRAVAAAVPHPTEGARP